MLRSRGLDVSLNEWLALLEGCAKGLHRSSLTGFYRLCRAVRRGLALSLLGSAAGTLLAFYMAFLGKYSLMPPLTLLAFLLLWVLPVLLLTDWTGRY